MVRKAWYVTQGDLRGHQDGVHAHEPKSRRAGVRAPIVAMKRRNGRGAKGRRKVETVTEVSQTPSRPSGGSD